MEFIKVSQILSTSHLRSYRDDDLWVDRLSHRYSVVLFCIFAILITSKAYIGNPIDCWSPPEFKKSYEQYAETLCFVNGTYYISETEIDIPIESNQRYQNRVRYYQWTPFILLLLALMSYFPRALWTQLNTKYGINLKNLVDAAKKYESVESVTNKQKILAYICKNLLTSIQFNEYINNKKYNFFNKKHLNSAKKQAYVENRIHINKMLNILHSEATNKNTFDMLPNKIYISDEYNYSSNIKNRSKTPHSFKPKSDTSQQNSILIKRSSLRKKRHENSFFKELNLGENTQDLMPTYTGIKKQVNFQSTVNLNDVLSNSSIDTLNKSSPCATITKKLKLNAPKITKKQKYVLNFLSSKYDSNNDDLNISSQLDEQKAYRVKQKIYMVNNTYLKELLEIKPSNINNINSESSKCCSLNILIPNLSINYLTRLYLCVKFFYLLGTIGQFLFLNHLIGNRYYMIGIDLIKSFFYELEWPHLAVFPRKTLCEILVREVGVVHPYLIQCVLSINLFNEVIFIIIWYWLFLIILLTGLDLLLRFFYNLTFCSNCERKMFTLKYLEMLRFKNSKSNKAQKFPSKFKLDSILDVNILGESIESHNNIMYLSIQKYKNLLKSAKNSIHSNKFTSSIDESLTNSDDSEMQDIEYQNIVNQLNKFNSNDFNMKSKLILILASEEEIHDLFDKFCEHFNNDTIFALKVIQENASNLIVSEIVEHMWSQFKCVNFVFSNDANDYLLKKTIFINE